MPWDERLADRIRGNLAGETIVEKRMFGGLAFMRQGHMVCGLYRGGAFFRVGKPNEAEALAVLGARRMDMGGRPMPGMIELPGDAAGDDTSRTRLVGLAMGFVRGLPPK